MRSTMHMFVAHELTSKSQFAKRASFFAKSPSLQTCPAVATFLTVMISRAPTPFVRGRAQKKCPLRAQGYVASSEESPIFGPIVRFTLHAKTQKRLKDETNRRQFVSRPTPKRQNGFRIKRIWQDSFHGRPRRGSKSVVSDMKETNPRGRSSPFPAATHAPIYFGGGRSIA